MLQVVQCLLLLAFPFLAASTPVDSTVNARQEPSEILPG